ncbi:MAG: putative membrane protein [Cocleimonas sp.]|jgi:uncharacterized membrane protein
MHIVKLWRAMAALGIIGLVVLIVLWNSWLTPVQVYPRSVEILFLAGPLLFFTRGIMHARRYTMVVITMVSFAYILMGIWYILSVDEIIYGYLLFAFSFLMFLGSLMHVWVMDKREKLAHPERFKKKKSKMSRR